MVLHQLVDKLTEELKLTPEQQFRLTADIKRLIHHEKASVYHRCWLYGQGAPIFDRANPDNVIVIGHEPPQDEFLHRHLDGKFKDHQRLARLPDEKLVTWDVGSHKYVQDVGVCVDCQIDLRGKDYMAVYGRSVDLKGKFCRACATKRNLWEGA